MHTAIFLTAVCLADGNLLVLWLCRQHDKLLAQIFSLKESIQKLRNGYKSSLRPLLPPADDKFMVSWLRRQYDKLLADFSSPKEGTKALKFDTKYPKPFVIQFKTVFDKYWAAYWRMPEYNGFRFFYAISVGLLFGAIFWRLG